MKERKGERTISVKEYVLIQDIPEDPYAPLPIPSPEREMNNLEKDFEEPDEGMGMKGDTTEPAQEEPEQEYGME